MNKEQKYIPKKHSIEAILVRNFDNNKYQWRQADKELNELFDEAIQQERERIIEEIEDFKSGKDDCDCKDKNNCAFKDRVGGWNDAIDEIIINLNYKYVGKKIN